MKRVCIVAETTASIEEIQKRSGLLPPYEMEEKDSPAYDGPTERQLAYAQKVGVFIPADATSGDATVFLTRYEEGRPLCAPPTPDRIIRLLMDRGIVLPAYAGVYEASNLYFHNIALEERIAFFAMRVYCSLYRAKYCLLEDAPQSERFGTPADIPGWPAVYLLCSALGSSLDAGAFLHMLPVICLPSSGMSPVSPR